MRTKNSEERKKRKDMRGGNLDEDDTKKWRKCGFKERIKWEKEQVVEKRKKGLLKKLVVRRLEHDVQEGAKAGERGIQNEET